jgi:hypothetical protein
MDSVGGIVSRLAIDVRFGSKAEITAAFSSSPKKANKVNAALAAFAAFAKPPILTYSQTDAPQTAPSVATYLPYPSP